VNVGAPVAMSAVTLDGLHHCVEALLEQ
jgi:hypothetical protein